MKNLFFLALALIGLGLSSCQKEEALSAAPCTDCIEILNIRLHNYMEFKLYGYYYHVWDHWDREESSAIEKRPDLFVRIRDDTYPHRRYIYEGSILAENAPRDSTILLTAESIFIPADSFPNARIQIMDQDYRSNINRWYHDEVGHFYINPREIMDDKISHIVRGQSDETQISFDVKFH